MVPSQNFPSKFFAGMAGTLIFALPNPKHGFRKK